MIINHACVFYSLISNLNDAWTPAKPLYYVCAAWSFVNIHIFLIGVVKVTLQCHHRGPELFMNLKNLLEIDTLLLMKK